MPWSRWLTLPRAEMLKFFFVLINQRCLNFSRVRRTHLHHFTWKTYNSDKSLPRKTTYKANLLKGYTHAWRKEKCENLNETKKDNTAFFFFSMNDNTLLFDSKLWYHLPQIIPFCVSIYISIYCLYSFSFSSTISFFIRLLFCVPKVITYIFWLLLVIKSSLLLKIQQRK